jgi:peptide/nickel transport system substrate-binding protein
MKRRVFTRAFLFGLVCSPAFAADPVPALQETPMFAEQVTSGALPPVADRIPRPPWVVRKFAGGEGPGR